MHSQFEAIFQAVEYIEGHLEDDISVSQIAAEVNYSLFHFLRTFNKVTHHTPYDYLIRRRLSEAARRLTLTSRRIIDIGQDFCFHNQESFSRAFRRMFGIQPGQWRRNSVKPLGRPMEALTKEDLHFRNHPDFCRPVIEDRRAAILAGLMTSVDSDDAGRLEKRAELVLDILNTGNRITAGDVFFVSSPVSGQHAKTYLFAGASEEGICGPADALVSKVIPGGCYVKICSRITDRAFALNYLYDTWLPLTGLAFSDHSVVEAMKIGELETRRGQIEILIPVEQYQIKPH